MPHQESHYIIIGDGKPGHENQSRGLAEAFQRTAGGKINYVAAEGIFRTAKAIQKVSENHGPPEFLIAAGHRTHWPLLYAARRLKVKSIVLMKPTLPTKCFTWCIIPHHDFKGGKSKPHVIRSFGALNRILPTTGNRSGKLALIGGPSSSYGWDTKQLLAQLKSIGSGLIIADSRRTPEGFLQETQREIELCKFAPHRDLPEGWLQERLKEISEIYVTEDSVSMIYEALVAGPGCSSSKCLESG